MKRMAPLAVLMFLLTSALWPATLSATKIMVRKPAAEPPLGQPVVHAAISSAVLEAYSASLVAEYDTYYVVQVSKSSVDKYTEQLSTNGYRSGVMDSYDLIRVNGYKFFSNGPLPALPSDLTISDYSGSQGLYLVQFVSPNRAEWYEALRSVGEPIGYFPENTFLLRATPGRLSAFTKNPFVQHVSVYQPAYKLRADVRDADGPVLATVQLDGGQDLDGVTSILDALAGTKVSFEPTGPIRNVTLWLTPAEARSLAALPEVIWIEQQLPVAPSDERQALATAGRVYTAGGAVRPTPPAPWPGAYQSWLETAGFCTSTKTTNCTNYWTRIAVFDSGLDRNVCGAPPADCLGAGDTHTFHPDFGTRQYRFLCATDSNSVPQCKGIDGVPANKYDYSDGLGHGTAVAAAIAGDPVAGVAASPTPTPAPASLDPQGYFLGTGSAPKSTLVTYRIWDAAGQAFIDNFGAADLERWHREVYNALGSNVVRFANHSWNTVVDTTYNARTQKFDQLVRDSDGGYDQYDRPITLVVAAGNDSTTCGNPQQHQAYVESPGNAKNVITVGATEDWRPSDDSHYPWNTACGGYASLNNIACFSRRELQYDLNRAKPELVAPGSRIGSALSRDPRRNMAWPPANCFVTPTPAAGDPNQGYYVRTTGTSFATPIVTGAAALVDTWSYWKSGQHVPSPALVKALLIASADPLAGGTDEMTGGSMSGYVPNMYYGWGQPDLTRLFQTSVPVKIYDEDHSTQGAARFTPGKSLWTVSLTRANPNKDVVAVMVFTDRFAQTGAYESYVNSLFMFLYNSTHFYYSNFSDLQGYTVRDQGDIPGQDNNVLFIRIKPSDFVGNSFTIEVVNEGINGNAVPGLDGNGPNQDFALYVYNAQ